LKRTNLKQNTSTADPVSKFRKKLGVV